VKNRPPRSRSLHAGQRRGAVPPTASGVCGFPQWDTGNGGPVQTGRSGADLLPTATLDQLDHLGIHQEKEEK